MGVVSEAATAVADNSLAHKPLKIKILTKKPVISACVYKKQIPKMSGMKKSASAGNVSVISSCNGKLTSSVVGTKRKIDEVGDCEKEKRLKMDRYATSNCSFVMGKLLKHRWAYPFKKPVDPVELGIPDYFDIITSPMDLGTIKQKLDNNKYGNYQEFESDIRLTFSNAMLYNPAENFVHQYAKELMTFFEHLWKPVKAKMNRQLEGTKQLTTHNNTEETMHYSQRKCLKFSVKLPGHNENMKPMSFQKIEDHVSQKVLKDTSSHVDDLPGQTNGKDNEELTEVSHKTNENGSKRCESLKPLSSQKVIAETMHDARRKYPKSNFSHVDKLPASGTLSNVKETQELMEASDSKKVHMRGRKDVKDVKAKGCTSSKLCGSSTNICSKSSEKRNETRVGEVNKCSTQLSKCAQGSNGRSDTCSADEKNACSTSGPKLDIPLSPSKALRAAMLKSRFADTILKAQLLNSGSGTDMLKLQQEKERMERQQREEKARIEAQIKAAESAARIKAECEIRQRREQERIALEKVEQCVDLDDNFHVLRELEGLLGRPLFVVAECRDGRSYAAYPWDEFECHELRSPLEQLGLFMKAEYLACDDDYDDEESESMEEGEWEEGEVIF